MMPFLKTNLRLSDTNRPDVTKYLPLWNFLLGFTTSIRQNSTRNTIHDSRVITRIDVSGLDITPGTYFFR
jgi:hypothetical protein